MEDLVPFPRSLKNGASSGDRLCAGQRDPCKVCQKLTKQDCEKRQELGCDVVWVGEKGTPKPCKTTKGQSCEHKEYYADGRCQKASWCNYRSEAKCTESNEAGSVCSFRGPPADKC